MERNFQEERIWQRWAEVRKAFYDDYKEVDICLEMAYSVMADIEESKIEVNNTYNFSINVEMAQILIYGGYLTDAKAHLKIADKYAVTEYNKAYLCWKMAELYFKDNKEESFVLFSSALKYFEDIKEYENINQYRNELAIKHQMAKNFKIYKYVKEIIFEYIELYKQKKESLTVIKDTYKTFKELATENNDYMFLHKVNKELNLLKIAL